VGVGFVWPDGIATVAALATAAVQASAARRGRAQRQLARLALERAIGAFRFDFRERGKPGGEHVGALRLVGQDLEVRIVSSI
jgi:hypothetical protein